MSQHVFVAMPFGIQEGINFDEVYRLLIRPSLVEMGLTVFRLDEEIKPGNIRTDMFQELLLADLVVADLSINNPNVWYELGVRHALRKAGVLQIQCTRDYMPFDVYSERMLRYHVKGGVPDADMLQADRGRLRTMAEATLNRWHGERESPVYHLLTNLQEPDWKKLRVGVATKIWDEFECWVETIETARRRDRAADIMTLADEVPNRALKLEAHRKAGEALRATACFKLALEQYERALALDPVDLDSRKAKGVLLGKLGRHDESITWAKSLAHDHPHDAEAWALVGRCEKDKWLATWVDPGADSNHSRKSARRNALLVQEAAEAYLRGFVCDPTSYYTGIAALAGHAVFDFLTGGKVHKALIKELEGGVRWAARSALEVDDDDFWARATLGEVEVFCGTKKGVRKAYRAAVAVSDNVRFMLLSAREQLQTLKDVGYNEESVRAGIEVLDESLARLDPGDGTAEPRLVFLFSGHMIDAPDRQEPRFPPELEEKVVASIRERLEGLGAASTDLCLSGGACGGDILFIEECLRRGMHVQLSIPTDDVPPFLEESVDFAGPAWRERFYRIVDDPRVMLLKMPDYLGPTPRNINKHARTTRWQLNQALAFGEEKVRFVCLWDMSSGIGESGTAFAYQTVKKRTGRVYVIDTRELMARTPETTAQASD